MRRVLWGLLRHGCAAGAAFQIMAKHDVRFVRVSKGIERGLTMTEAMSAAPDLFDPVWIAAVREGERQGAVGARLDDLVRYDAVGKTSAAGSGSHDARVVAGLWVLLRAGLPIAEATATALRAINSAASVRKSIDEQIANGARFFDILEKAECIAPLTTELLRVADAGGLERLTSMLDWLVEESLIAGHPA